MENLLKSKFYLSLELFLNLSMIANVSEIKKSELAKISFRGVGVERV